MIQLNDDLADYCEDHLKDEKMMQLLRDEKFDMIILE